MKTISKMLILLSLILCLVGIAAQPVGIQANAASMPEMSPKLDDGAIEALSFAEEQKVIASDGSPSHTCIWPGAGDYFGSSVAVYGDTALVGAKGKDNCRGAAYILVRNGSTWNQVTRLNASDATGLSYFGNSVALSGDMAVIGAPMATVNGTLQGAAYIFIRSGTDWVPQKKLIAPDGAAGDGFGSSVAISGNTVLVGTPLDDTGAISDHGSAYVFVRSVTTWSMQNKITASSLAAADQFGNSVALDGNTAVIGAPYWDWGANTNRGAAYVFTRSSGVWTQQQMLLGAYTDQGDNFGASVAISDERILVGAPNDDVHELGNDGSVRLFLHPTSGWSERYTVVGNQYGDEFGYSIAVSGDLAIIGARRAGGVGYASVYLLGRVDMSWQQTLKALDGHSQDYYGNSVAISGGTALAGAPFDDIGSNLSQGSAYFYTAQISQRLLNGGFNTYPNATSKIPTNWVKNANFSVTDGKDTTAANLKEGTASIKIANTTAKTKTLTQTLPLSGTGGNILVFSYWVKGNALPTAGGCQGQVLLYNGATLMEKNTLPCGANGTFGYRQRVISFRAFGSYNKVVVKFTYSKASGTVWFDLASLLK